MDARRRAALIAAVAAWPAVLPRGAITRFCEREGVSRDWVHRVRGRIQAEGLEAALLPVSRAPVSSPQAIDPVIAELACAIRLELIADGWDAGPLSVQSRMRARGVQPPSRATLARIFTRAGLVSPQPRKRPRSSWHRFVHPFPNSCWQLDAFIVRLADRSTAVGFQLTDDHSRLGIASLAARGETGDAAVQVVRTGIERHGIPQRLLTDNGSAFNLSRRGMSTPLTAYLTVLGVQAMTGRPSHPTTQGKNERHHATTRRWLAARPAPATITDLQQLLDEFDHAYNTQRPHQALGGQTPAAAYAALPKAAPHTPPSRQPAPEQQQITVRTVDSRAVIYAARRQFKVSTNLIGTTVIVLHDDHVFHLIDNHGTVIDTHTDPPLDRYIPRTTPSTTQET